MYAKLVDKQVVEIGEGMDAAMEWARSFNNATKIVRHTHLNRRRHILVSTVFLGMDHRINRKLWFETMVFGTSIAGRMERYPDYRSAELGHAKWVARARNARQVRDDRSRYLKLRRRGK